MKRMKSKIYSTARWLDKLRPLSLAKSYLCMYCYVEQSTRVDHLGGCPADNCNENLIPCCESCHNRKTTRVDLICRLINVQTLDDALLFAAKRSKHNFDVADYALIQLTPVQIAIYNLLKLNSLYRPQGLQVVSADGKQPTVYDFRYVLALIEVNRVNLDTGNPNQIYRSKRKA